MPDSRPLISVVVPTLNSEATLEACLSSLRRQTYKNLEIIVVDNHSTDRTMEIARRLADKVILSGPERSPQTNIGVSAAGGEFIYEIGSDFVLEETLIAEAVVLAESEGLDAVLIHNRSDPIAGFWARAREFEREMYRGDDLNVATRFVRRSVFLAVGGLDETMFAGEDYDLHTRLLARGARMDWITASETHIGEPRSARVVIVKHFYYGSNLRRYVRKHGRRAVRQLSPIRPAFLRNANLFFKHPVRAAGFLVYWFLKYAAGAAGFMFGRESRPPLYGESTRPR